MSYNVLIVDDSKIVRAVMRKTLGISGIDIGKIVEAGNGREGLEKLAEEWVDVVLADINMPEMTGEEMVDVMREKGYMSDIPVIVVSTERSITRIEALKSKGIYAYLNKPFTPEEVKDVVMGALAQRRQEQ